MMPNRMQIIVWFCAVISIANVVAGPWMLSQSQEALDEVNDVEIYRAVVKSMDEWQKRRNEKENSRRSKRAEDTNTICYADLGCFDASASGPFGYLDMLPNTPEEIDTKFLLYPGHGKRRSGNAPGEVPFRNLSDAFTWAKQGFNNTLPTKVMIHGFGSDCSHIWIYEMRSALMAVEEANVICVDWGNGASLPNYVKATANTRLVGKQLALLIKGLMEHTGMSLRNMHLIGFSLGAHVAGFAGAELGNLSRITGLDPAGPLFESQDPRARLDQTDADFVDVIHSNGENLILGGLGSWQPMGHVDFYPNGGRMQKGCSNIFVGAVSDIIWSSAVEGRSLCNHRRAYKFFTDSVSPRCHFPAFPCDSYDHFLSGECFPCTEDRECGNMGYYADRSRGKGQLYLITRDEEPFCAHQYHIKIESTPSETQTPIVSYGKIQITLIGDSLLNETFVLTKKEDDEMKLGSSVSRIVVPHPILLEPSKIQILYNAYSGWLTSGLLQWRIDKITLSDSFGKSSSVCKQNLVLESGVPVILPLYPGECNLPHDRNLTDFSVKYDKYDSEDIILTNNTKNKTDHRELFKNDNNDIFNLPWTQDKEVNNRLDNAAAESSRAFNTRLLKNTINNQQELSNSTKATNQTKGLPQREVVEPILKPHHQTSKIGRSHDPTRQKHEITEPILGPTTTKTSQSSPRVIIHNDIISRLTQNDKEIVYNFYDIEKDNEWLPAVNPTVRQLNDKWKREDEFAVNNNQQQREQDNTFHAIVRTVQFLPQRLARMFEEAEKYARETILPLVSTYTPKFLTDFISQPKLTANPIIPLPYEVVENLTTTTKRPTTVKEVFIARDISTENEITTTSSEDNAPSATNIQKIQRRRKSDFNQTDMTPTNSSNEARQINLPTTEINATTAKSKPEIYIDLPIFENSNASALKYIPDRKSVV